MHELDEITGAIVDSAMNIHKELGPGLLESVYHPCLIDEIRSLGYDVKSQIWVPVKYKGKDLGGVLKLDLLVENIIIVELKAVETMISSI